MNIMKIEKFLKILDKMGTNYKVLSNGEIVISAEGLMNLNNYCLPLETIETSSYDSNVVNKNYMNVHITYDGRFFHWWVVDGEKFS